MNFKKREWSHLYILNIKTEMLSELSHQVWVKQFHFPKLAATQIKKAFSGWLHQRKYIFGIFKSNCARSPRGSYRNTVAVQKALTLNFGSKFLDFEMYRAAEKQKENLKGKGWKIPAKLLSKLHLFSSL